MSEGISNRTASTTLSIIVVVGSIFWGVLRPDMWAWALGFAVLVMTLLSIAFNAGVKQGHEQTIIAEAALQNAGNPEGKTEEEIRIERIKDVMAEAGLFAYELEHGLVPDAYTEDNPGFGPMDFEQWRVWKNQEFEQTGNLWHNHPGGLPPAPKDET